MTVRRIDQKQKTDNPEEVLNVEIKELKDGNLALKAKITALSELISSKDDDIKKLEEKLEKLPTLENQKESLENQLSQAKIALNAAQEEVEELKENNSSLPAELKISKIGKATMEEDSTIYVACKMRTNGDDTDDALEPVILCASFGAFQGLYQKAKSASQKGASDDE